MNIFIAKTVYPDASSIFSFRLKSLREIKDTCFVIPDTNALLLPYTATQESVDQIRKTYRQLKSRDRLRIPSQVAREFAKNRPNKLSELYQQLSKKRNSNLQIPRSKYPLLESLDDYKKLLEIEKELSQLIDNYRDTIGGLMDHIRGWSWNDPVSSIYADLFTSEIVFEPVRDEDDVRKDLQIRNTHNIPPGYKDKSKDDDGVGDLLIWYTILELGRERDVIFVTGETKPDWWHRSENQHLYPRYELIDEFRRISSGKTFHIISLSELLGLYGAKDSVVKEVKQKEAQLSFGETSGDIVVAASKAEEAVFFWLLDNFNTDDVMINDGKQPYDFSFQEDGKKTAVEVKYIWHQSDRLRRIRDLRSHGEELVIRGEIGKYIGVLAAIDKETAMRVAKEIRPSKVEEVHIVIGYINSGGQFIVVTD